MHKTRVRPPVLNRHLTNRFQEWQRLDITHRAANLNHGNFGFASAETNEQLNLVGDVRNHLYRAPEIITAAFFFNHAVVDLAGGEVVTLGHFAADKAFVVAKIEIGFGAVFCYENFTVLKRAHSAWIDIDIRVELEQRDFDATGFEDGCQGRRGDPFTQRRNDPACDEYEFCHLGDKVAQTG